MFPKLFSGFALSAITAAALAFAAPAAASTVTLSQTNPDTVWARNGDGDVLSEDVTIFFRGRPMGDRRLNVAAGAFGVSDGGSDWLAFCIDLFQTYNIPADFDVVGAPGGEGSPFFQRLDKLYTSYFAGVDTSVEAAAFQIAIWEILYDGSFNLVDGEFRLAGVGDAVLSQVKAYLAGLDQQSGGGYAFTFLKNDGYQDLVIASPVPLPAGALLLLGALGAMGVVRRKTDVG